MSIYPPTGTLEIKNATLKIPVVDLQYTSNTAKLEANSNVVTEFSRSKKLIKYPRVAMTGPSAPTGYVASASSNYPGASSDPWQAFDNIWDPDGSGTNSWESHSSSFASGTTNVGPRSSTGLNTFDSNNGEYLNIKLPEKIVLQRYEHTTRANRWWEGPYSGFLYGSNDGFTTYEKIHTFSAIDLRSEASYIHTVNATKAYNEYRFHVTQTQASVYVSICLFNLFGTPEYDPEAHGTDVTVKSYPNVPNTDWLEVYYDAKDLTNISGTIADLSGKSVAGSLNGDVSIDTLNDVKSFSFDGSGDYISGTLTNTGDFDFTVSTWVFETNGTTNNSVWCIGNPSSANPSPAVALGINNVGSLDLFVFGGIEIRFSEFRDTFGINKWHHIVCTRVRTTIKYFINGIDQGRPIANSIPLSIAANSVFTIGVRAGSQLGNNPMHGKIANFRLFNRALTSDEIYQLYAYQKEDFGHGDLSMTLKAGRLGIGTSEPRVALDVRGEIRAVGSMLYLLDAPLTHEWHWRGSTSSTGSAHQVHYHHCFLHNCRAIICRGGGYNSRASANDTWSSHAR